MAEVVLSVLDLVPVSEGRTSTEALGYTAQLARHVEQVGFHRYWVGEHHGVEGLASSTPALVAAWVASNTTRLRVGTGGVLLQNSHALTVAEQFHTLEALFPGRIDLGIGRGQGMHATVAEALDGTEVMPNPRAFDKRFADLRSMIGGELSLGRSGLVIPVMPRINNPPSVWLLASTEVGAGRAAELGLPLAFAHHLGGDQTKAAVAGYRTAFQGSNGTGPYVAISVTVVVGEDDRHAAWLSRSYLAAFARYTVSGRMPNIPHPELAGRYIVTDAEREFVTRRTRSAVFGGPQKVRRELLGLVERTRAEELIINTIVHDHEECLQSFSRLVDALA